MYQQMLSELITFANPKLKLAVQD